MKFVSGLLVGIIACYFIMHKNETPAKAALVDVPSVEETASPKIVKHRAGKMDLPLAATLPDFKPNPVSIEAKMEMISSAPAESHKKKTKIQFSLQDIMRMESEWVNLHNQIQVSKEVRGWRVKMLAPNTVFASTGLTEGNLITYDSIRALGDEGNSNLPYRISTILNHVSVQ